MTRDELRARFPNASEAFLAQNAREVPDPKPQRHSGDEPVGSHAGKEAVPKSVRVVVTRVGKRLLDSDNLFAKYAVDCLRYAGVFPDDNPHFVSEVATRQKKADPIEEEHTIIEVVPSD